MNGRRPAYGAFSVLRHGEALKIPKILNDQIRVKRRAEGYPESELILALAASIFCGGDYLDDMEAWREDAAAKRIISWRPS